MPERRAVLPPAPGLEAGARPARPRWRPDLDGPQLLEPAARLPGRPGRGGEHAAPGRLLAGERHDREGRPLAEPALPLQHRRPLRPLRRRHGGGKGVPAAGQGGQLRGRAGGPPQDHRRAAVPGRRDRDRGHARAQRRPRRRGALAVALPGPRGDGRGLRLEERALRLHDELGGRAAPVRRPGGDGEGSRRRVRPRAAAGERLAPGLPGEVGAVGAVLRGHQHLLRHPDQRGDDGPLHPRAPGLDAGRCRRRPARARLGQRDVRQPALGALRRSRHERADGLRGAGQQPHLAAGLARAALGGGGRRPVAQGAGGAQPDLGDLHGGHRRQEPLLPRRHLAHRRLRRLRAPLPARDGGGAGARAPRPEPPAADELGRPVDRVRKGRDRLREVGRGLAGEAQARGVGARGDRGRDHEVGPEDPRAGGRGHRPAGGRPPGGVPRNDEIEGLRDAGPPAS